MNFKIDFDRLLKLDLRSYNNGQNPYGEADHSVDKAFNNGISYHREYVQNRAGAAGHGRVLDLLCGFGRWLPFLAEANDEVVGIERLDGCVKIARGICNDLELSNVSLHAEDVSFTKSFPDEHFDYIWMWSALQYVHRGQVLCEANRILRPGGRLFVGAYNAPGIMIDHMLNGLRSGTLESGASAWAQKALHHGEFWNGNPNFASPAAAVHLLEAFGFECVAAEPEGNLSIETGQKSERKPASRVNEFGWPKTTEFVAQKPLQGSDTNSFLLGGLSGNPVQQRQVRAMLIEDGVVDLETLVSWVDNPSPDVQTNVEKVLRLRGVSAVNALQTAISGKKVDRLDCLRDLLDQIAEDASNPETNFLNHQSATAHRNGRLMMKLRRFLTRLLGWIR